MSIIGRLKAQVRAEGDPDEQKMAAAQRGDRRAFDALVSAYQPQLRGFLTRRVGPAAVDDILQETWLAAWVALPRFQRRARFKAWLFGIAVHKCMDHHRASGPHRTEMYDDEADSGGRTIEELYAAAELRETVQAQLARLPAAQREVVEMYYYVELTLPEIARVLCRNLNTVKYQFYRAHALIAQGLAPSPALEARPPLRALESGVPK